MQLQNQGAAPWGAAPTQKQHSHPTQDPANTQQVWMIPQPRMTRYCKQRLQTFHSHRCSRLNIEAAWHCSTIKHELQHRNENSDQRLQVQSGSQLPGHHNPSASAPEARSGDQACAALLSFCRAPLLHLSVQHPSGSLASPLAGDVHEGNSSQLRQTRSHHPQAHHPPHNRLPASQAERGSCPPNGLAPGAPV